MKPAFALLLWLLAGSALAQADTDTPEASHARERARIQAERVLAQSRFDDAAAECYQRFAVNDCLRDARDARRDVLADLRRQDLSLNSEEARRKAADRLTRLEKKSSVQP
jgi:colicin import membrane protein